MLKSIKSKSKNLSESDLKSDLKNQLIFLDNRILESTDEKWVRFKKELETRLEKCGWK